MKFSKRLQILSTLLLTIIVLFISCDVTDNSDNTDGTGQLIVQLTDAPGDYDAVFIDIQSVRVKFKENFEVEDGLDEEGWITVSNEAVRVDLLSLQNGNTIILGDEELEAGTYHQIRLILGDDNAIVIDGESVPLKTPSAQQSGLKLNIDAEIENDETYLLLIDFDASKSIVKAGNSGKYVLEPVLRAVALEEAGSIKGTVQPDNFQTEMLAIANGDTYSTFTETDGEFKIMGVIEGTYDVVFMPNSDAYADTTLTDVVVTEDEDIALGTITLHEL